MTPEQESLWQQIEQNTAELKRSLTLRKMNDAINEVNPGVAAEFEQEWTAVENIGRLVGVYYRTLTEEGLPEMLVFSLVEDMQNYQLSMLARGEH